MGENLELKSLERRVDLLEESRESDRKRAEDEKQEARAKKWRRQERRMSIFDSRPLDDLRRRNHHRHSAGGNGALAPPLDRWRSRWLIPPRGRRPNYKGRGRLKLAPEARDARGCGKHGRLGHGPGWL
jgi:hypothetical protein